MPDTETKTINHKNETNSKVLNRQIVTETFMSSIQVPTNETPVTHWLLLVLIMLSLCLLKTLRYSRLIHAVMGIIISVSMGILHSAFVSIVELTDFAYQCANVCHCNVHYQSGDCREITVSM